MNAQKSLRNLAQFGLDFSLLPEHLARSTYSEVLEDSVTDVVLPDESFT
jgi:hypothetical protein